jgi:RNA polymerase sigma-70 factor, ECF subfamily
MSDTEIVQTVLAGNREAFRIIADKYQGVVFRTCMGFVHNKEDAEDITQDVLVNVYQSLPSFRGNAEFSTWVYRIAINASLNFMRKKSRQVIVTRIENLFHFGKTRAIPHFESNMYNPEQILTNRERSEQIHKAMGSLPENQRIAFTLSKYDDLPQRDISKIMDMSEGAVEALLYRAKANLQNKLAGMYKKRRSTTGKNKE